jgi:hypothetical protein
VVNPTPNLKDDDMEDTISIKTCKCDDCGRTAPGLEYTSLGSPVLFVCKHCEPKRFEDVARKDIDSWLQGGAL